MKTFYRRTFLHLIKDPGFLIAVANALLFLNNSLLAFFIVITALIIIVGLKSYAYTPTPHAPYLKILHHIGQKKFLGLEIIGYACLTVALIAMIRQLFIDFVSSFCFGFANLFLALRYETPLNSQQQNWEFVSKNVFNHCSLTPFFIALFQEPIFLVCLGYLHAGLAAGHEALWIFPILCIVPYITIKYPHINRAIPQGALCFCALWFTFIALSHRIWTLSLSNVLCTLAYIEIAYQEHKIFLSKQNV